MDVLTELIDTLRLRGTTYCRTELTAPWGMALPPSDVAHFHVVQQGVCWVQLDGDAVPTRLSAGDLVVIPHGRGHRLLDAPGSEVVPLESLLGGHPGGKRPVIRHGGGGAATTFICGAFQFERREGHPLLSVLPGLLHVASEAGETPAWLQSTLTLLAEEIRRDDPGSEAIVSRLVDVIFVQTMRVWIGQLPVSDGNWLRALRDPQIGTAIGAMHRAPAEPWTVGRLAAEAGMSRSAFAERFTQLVGTSPMTHLFRWRMARAAGQLRQSTASLAKIAAQHGYESEAAFSKAFKRHFGQPPGAYRRKHPAA